MRIPLSAVAMLTIATLLWAANAVVGRVVVGSIPPITLNFFRWAIAFAILLPLAPWVLRRDSDLWRLWPRYLVLGLLGIGCFNALQYLALETSSPVNVTLVNATVPLWALIVGRLFFGGTISRTQLMGAALSFVGVVVVLTRGEFAELAKWRLVPGDGYMLIAAILWAFYTWLLLPRGTESKSLRSHWAPFLLAQVTFGVVWSGLFAAGEWALTDAHIQWSWPLAAALVFVGMGPAVLSFRFWTSGVHRAGANVASLFINLIPVFAAIMSTLFLNERPQLHHVVAFLLIISGIWISARHAPSTH